MAVNTIIDENKVISAIPTARQGTVDTGLSRVYRQGRVVTMTSVISGVEITSDWADIVTIPAEYRPAMTYTIMGNAGMSRLIQVRVNPDGSVQIRSDPSTNMIVRIMGSWIV